MSTSVFAILWGNHELLNWNFVLWFIVTLFVLWECDLFVPDPSRRFVGRDGHQPRGAPPSIHPHQPKIWDFHLDCVNYFSNNAIFSVNVETLSGEFWETAPPNLYFVSHLRGLECPDVRWSLAASQDCQRPVGLGPARVGRSVGGSLDSVMINSSAVLCCLVWYAKKRVKSDDIQ